MTSLGCTGKGAGNVHWVECVACGARGPCSTESAEHAVSLWNARRPSHLNLAKAQVVPFRGGKEKT